MQRQPENLEMSLREHLLAAQQSAMQAGMQTSPPHHHHEHMHHHPGPVGPHDHNIDPAIAGHPYAMSPESADDSIDKRNGKRELSKTKRAAQNRAAQRAFRQRKEGYIKNLEDEVRAFKLKEETWNRIQQENYQLRDYIISLQSRLLESQGDYPLPPPSINLPHPRDGPNESLHQQLQQQPVPTAPMGTGGMMGSSAVSQLQAAAAQAGELDRKDDGVYAAGARGNGEAGGGMTGGMTGGKTLSTPVQSGHPSHNVFKQWPNSSYDKQHPTLAWATTE